MAENGQYDSQINLEQEEYEQETTVEQEDSELEITMQPEAATVYGGSMVNSVNGQVGDVILTTSDLENTSDYQTGEQVQAAIAGKQDELTAGDNITINNNIISATDTTYTAGSGLDLDGTTFSVDTNTIATVQDVTNEATTRENADTSLQGQIDALTVSSDVIDVVGTYQNLQNYDTTHVKDNDIIKVLQDSTHNNAMSYYRWVVTDHVGAWVYVGSEGPYYTKSEADTLLNNKQNIEDNSLNTTNKTIVGAINEVDGIAKGANQALSFVNYSTMVTEFNSLSSDEYNVGQNIYIQTVDVPDLWISNVESTSSTYTYVDDATIISALDTNGYIQVGYYKLSALETQKVDLTGYVKNTDYASSSVGGVIKLSDNYATAVNNGLLYAQNKTYTDYVNSAYNGMLIGKGTLENVITGKGLVSNTDYASSTGGVFRINANYGTNIDANGYLRGVTKSYSDYDSTHNLTFICKSTLENVITGKRLTANKNYYGTCSTAASQAAKVVVCEGFVLETGAHISVEFVNSCNVNGTVTLNVNSTGAVDIANVGTEKSIQRIWQPGEIVDFVYDGTNYVIVKGGFATTVFYGLTKLSDSTSSTSTDLAATANSVKTAYDLANGKQDPLTAGTGIDITGNVISATGSATVSGETVYYGVSSSAANTQNKTVTVDNGFTLHDGASVRVLFSNNQTYNGAPTLNVNSTGAKTVQYKSGANGIRYLWQAGQVVDFVYRESLDVWIMVMGGFASTSYYGITKLASSTTSTTTTTALTPYSLNAVMANIVTGYPAYSTSSTYAVGDRVRYDWYVYECTTAITTAEAWDENHWTAVDPLQTQIDALAARISALGG